jgi:hypothetical protein
MCVSFFIINVIFISLNLLALKLLIRHRKI